MNQLLIKQKEENAHLPHTLFESSHKTVARVEAAIFGSISGILGLGAVALLISGLG